MVLLRVSQFGVAGTSPATPRRGFKATEIRARMPTFPQSLGTIITLPEEPMAFDFKVNGKAAHSDAPPSTPLLWVIREELKLTGTKFGCGTGLCGACMVHIDGKRAFSCQ